MIREERDRADGKMTLCDEGWTDDFVVTYRSNNKSFRWRSVIVPR